MRWLASVVVLGACQFSPGVLSSDAQGQDDAPADAPVDAAKPCPCVRSVEIVDGKVAGGPHTDFPLLVSVTAPWLRSTASGGGVARDDGFDIYFSADPQGATRLAHEVDAYTPLTGTLVAWVKVPELSAGSVLYLHYGDPAITMDQQDVEGVWSGGYQIVLHLEDDDDASGNVNSQDLATTGTEDGMIANAQAFDGVDDNIDYGSPGAVDNVFTGGGMVEGWIYPKSFGESLLGRVFDKGNADGWSFSVNSVDVKNGLGFAHGGNGGSVGLWLSPADSIIVNTWQHVAVVYNKNASSNDAVLYINGTAVTTTRASTPTGGMDSDNGHELWAGNEPGGDRTFDGLLDELRLSTVSRSAEWIGTQYQNQAEPSSFLSFGAPL